MNADLVHEDVAEIGGFVFWQLVDGGRDEGAEIVGNLLRVRVCCSGGGGDDDDKETQREL